MRLLPPEAPERAMRRGGSRDRLRFSDDSNASFEREVEWNVK